MKLNNLPTVTQLLGWTKISTETIFQTKLKNNTFPMLPWNIHRDTVARLPLVCQFSLSLKTHSNSSEHL